MLGAHFGWSGYHYQDIPSLDSDEADSDTAGLLQSPSRRAYNLSTNPSMQYNNKKGDNIGSVTEESKWSVMGEKETIKPCLREESGL